MQWTSFARVEGDKLFPPPTVFGRSSLPAHVQDIDLQPHEEGEGAANLHMLGVSGSIQKFHKQRQQALWILQGQHQVWKKKGPKQ